MIVFKYSKTYTVRLTSKTILDLLDLFNIPFVIRTRWESMTLTSRRRRIARIVITLTTIVKFTLAIVFTMLTVLLGPPVARFRTGSRFLRSVDHVDVVRDVLDTF